MTPTTDPAVAAAELEALRAAVERARPAYLADLERLVNLDCGSYTKDGVDEVGRWVRARLESLGASVTVHPNDLGLGDTVIGELAGNDPTGPTLLAIGHMDTVFDPGTAAERPFAIDERGIATGPGVTDMKSGLLAGLYALAALRETVGLPLARVVFVANPDEEIGSPASTAHIRRVAADADACLVLECARMNGDIVSSRKGNAGIRVTVHGRASHAGIEPEKGRNSILEAARMVTATPGAQRHLAGRDRQRRHDRGRHAAERRARRVLAGDRPAEHEPRGARGGRGGGPRDRPARGLRRHHDRRGGHRPPLADGEARTVGPARGPCGGAGGSARVPAPRRRDGRRVGREHDRRHGRARRSTASGRSAATTTRPTSTSRRPRSCPGRRSSPALIAAIGRDPEVRSWRLEREANAAGSEDLA